MASLDHGQTVLSYGLTLGPNQQLGSFFLIGTTQFLFRVHVTFFGLFLGRLLLFQVVDKSRVPINLIIGHLLEKLVVVFVITVDGALSSSTFVLLILTKKR